MCDHCNGYTYFFTPKITIMNPIFSTSDLSLVTSLMCLHHKPITLSREDNKGTFIFSDTPELTRDIELYFKYELRIEPIEYFTMLKTLKTRLYNHSDLCLRKKK